MRTNNVSNISFKRTYQCIDMHVHDNGSVVAKQAIKATSSDATRFMKEYQVDGDTFVLNKIIPSSMNCLVYQNGKPLANEIQGNTDILKTYENTSVSDFLAVCQPKTGSVENIKQLLENNPDKFVGLKFHPQFSELEADSDLYDSYLEFAKEKKLPCLFHSDRTFDMVYKDGKGGLWPVNKSLYSRPEQIHSLAKRHPDVPIILGHCGGAEKQDIDACIDVVLKSIKKNDSKLYVDISWVGIDDYKDGERYMEKIVDIIKKLKNSSKGDMTERVLFGTDIPIDRFSGGDGVEIYGNYIKDISKAIKREFPDEAEELTEKIFFKNSQELFFNKNWAKKTQGAQKTLKKSLPKIAFLGACVGAMAYFGYKIIKINKTNETK